jgi:hypothetical protein
MGTITKAAFLGIEAEHTTAFGRTTLFLVGLWPAEIITFLIEKSQEELLTAMPELGPLSHIFFGADHSFDGNDMHAWTKSIQEGLKEGFWCSLDMHPAQVPLIHMTGLCRNPRFIPIIGIRIPRVSTLGVNASLKIDDVATNAGVWCHHISKLLIERDSFTSWDKYEKKAINVEQEDT